MVEEIHPQEFARLLHALGQPVVLLRGPVVAARVIVARHHYRGIVEDGLLHYHAHVDRRLRYASVAHPYGLYQLEPLVHQQHVKLLHVQVLHKGVHIVVYRRGRAQVGPFLRLLPRAPLAQLARREYGYRLRRPYALEAFQVGYRHLAKGVEVVVARRHHRLHQFHGTHLRRARANEYGQQLCV